MIWPKLFEQKRRITRSAGMIAVDGRVQGEGEVVHVIAYGLQDLSEAYGAWVASPGSSPLADAGEGANSGSRDAPENKPAKAWNIFIRPTARVRYQGADVELPIADRGR